MPNGIAILTAEGIKEFPIRSYYGAEQGRLRFELKKLDVVYFQLIGEGGKGFQIENLTTICPISILPSAIGNKFTVAIGQGGFTFVFNSKPYRFLLSQTDQQNPDQLGQLPEFMRKAFGGKTEIVFI